MAVWALRQESTPSLGSDDILTAAEEYLLAMDAIESGQAKGEKLSIELIMSAKQAEDQWRSVNPTDVAVLLRELAEFRQNASPSVSPG